MFIYNVKINGSKTFKYFFTGIVLLVIIIVGIVTFKIFDGAQNNPKNSSCIPRNNVSKIAASNYTNVLKSVHDNIDDYIGLKINFTGYVYRMIDFNDNQFVLARNMVISSDFQTVVVGFLCECEEIKNFKDNTWVEITGTVTKGDYHGDMPIIKVNEIKDAKKPNEELVYPPDESYIPTSGII